MSGGNTSEEKSVGNAGVDVELINSTCVLTTQDYDRDCAVGAQDIQTGCDKFDMVREKNFPEPLSCWMYLRKHKSIFLLHTIFNTEMVLVVEIRHHKRI